jgi:protein-S-isoprenylcysteine O-methyltransferase Ste14
MTEQKDSSGARIHPPVLAALNLIAVFLLGWLVPVKVVDNVSWFGWFLVLAALIFAFGGLRELIRAKTSPDPHSPTTAIATSGIYRLTRNPIYVGYMLLVMGLPLIFQNIWGVILSPLVLFLFYRLIVAYEEAYLARKFGKVYLDYKSKVRRWL